MLTVYVSIEGLLENFFFAHLSQNFSAKLHRGSNNFFHPFFGCFPFYGFSAYAARQQSSLNARCIVAICDVAFFIGPPAPDIITSIDYSAFSTFEQITSGGTIFYFTQHRHYLSVVSYKIQFRTFSRFNKNGLGV